MNKNVSKTYLYLRWTACLVLYVAMVPSLFGDQSVEDSVSKKPVATVFFNNLTWDSESKLVNLSNDESAAHFTFNFTNLTSTNITIDRVQPSCGCTTAQLPALPWSISSRNGGSIGLTVDIKGYHTGTLRKSVDVNTDRGSQQLELVINIIPFKVPSSLPEDERTKNLKAAMADRQAVFRGSCVNCHARPAKDKYAKELYATACSICHEAEHRSPAVPDLHMIPQATNREFWRSWIAYGRPHSLMPAFAASEGGSLTDEQIASLADYLVGAIPSKRFQ